jgi:hypothetical protein
MVMSRERVLNTYGLLGKHYYVVPYDQRAQNCSEQTWRPMTSVLYAVREEGREWLGMKWN